MTEPDKLYQSWRHRDSYFNRMLDCGYNRNEWIATALKYLPFEILDGYKESLYFFALTECVASRLAPKCREREVIVLSDDIFPVAGEPESSPAARYFIFVVLHEVAHVIGHHKSPRFDGLSGEENKVQEREADELAYKWFNHYVANKNNLCAPLSASEVQETEERYQKMKRENLRRRFNLNTP